MSTRERILVVASLFLGAIATEADTEQFKPVELPWSIFVNGQYRSTPKIDVLFPSEFERVDYQSDGIPIYYGPRSEVEELTRAGAYRPPALVKGVFEVKVLSNDPNSPTPFYNRQTQKFAFEEAPPEQLHGRNLLGISVEDVSRIDTSTFPILIAKGGGNTRSLRAVLIALPDEEGNSVLWIGYRMPLRGSTVSEEIWNRFIKGIRER